MVPWWVRWAMGFAVSLLLAPASWGAMLPVNTFVGPFGAGDEVARHWEIKDFGGIDDPRGRFLQTAAVIRCLDFLLCCDSSVSHLAGALGVPVLLILGLLHDPRWGSRERPVWYPRHHVRRSRILRYQDGDWADVIEDLAAGIAAALDRGAWKRPNRCQ